MQWPSCSAGRGSSVAPPGGTAPGDGGEGGREGGRGRREERED